MRSADDHLDDELLTLLALGEDTASDDERAHADACPRCRAEVDKLREVVELARPAVELVPPAPRVWDAIAAELELGAAPVGTAAATDGPAVPAPGAPAPEQAATADVVPLTRRRRAGWAWVAAAAVAGLVVGSAVTWGIVRQPAAQVVATATLEPLPGWTASGSAAVESRSDGTRELVVDLEGDVGEDGFREVWLLRPDLSGLVSVGTLEGGSGRFDLPSGLDLDDFSVVDVSEEPFDGDPAHSGDSIVRGGLTA